MKSCIITINGVEFRKVGLADRFFLRLRGLIGRDVKEVGGLYIKPCSQIHMIGMSYPIDAVYLSRSGCVLKTEENIPVNKICRSVRSCSRVLELEAGAVAKNEIAIGDVIGYSKCVSKR